MNLPNKLTTSRFVLTAAFLWAMFSRSPVNNTLALVFFSLAGVTDFLDGKIARDRKLITDFGTLMDPLADKILTCSAFIALIERHMSAMAAGTLPPVFHLGTHPVRQGGGLDGGHHCRARTGHHRSAPAASKNVVLAAERYGKHKTISQIAAIIALLVMNAYGEWWPWLHNLFSLWTPWFALLTLWLTVVLTASSGLIYLWRNRALYLNEM